MKFLAVLLIAAALAGCVSDGPDSDQMLPTDSDGTSEHNGFAPQGTQIEAVDDDISLVGVYDTCEAGWCLDLTATNEGSTTYYVDAICANPFSDSMEQGGYVVQHREPTAQCLAFGTKEFGPGEMLTAQFTWDQTTWDDDKSSPADGAYQWSGHFRAYNSGDGGDGPRLTVTHTIVTGAT